MCIPWSELRLAGSPFHEVIPGAQAYPLGQINLLVTLKMLGLNDIITVSSAFSHAFTCNREHFELATTVINSSELLRLEESLTPAALDYNKPNSSTAFRQLKETKAVGIDPTDPTKTVRIGTQLLAK
ncbi:uncharacterized protein [Miscanthus floridulus]|uniref:uncharacterized protein n=1 Tax=Miscanthus floridulus TaxID=154761 RepID=UPI003458D4D6